MINIKQFESFSKEKEIHDICKKYKIKDYVINDDLSINVNGDIYLDRKELTELPLIFNIIDGDFICNNNKLTSLKGAPRKCIEFYCSNNHSLRTLEYVPNIEFIDINNTAISSFEYLPNNFEVDINDKLKHICELICKDLSYYNVYILDEIELFNDYRIIDDKDYVNNKSDKATLNMFKLKDFLEELKIDKEIDIKVLEKHFYIK